MKFIDLKIKYKNNGIIDIRNVINFFGCIDRRRLYEWQKKRYIRKITNNWYIFSDIEIDDIILKTIANRIYPPSYIGLESALVYYELIPEAAFQITSITTRKTKLFKTSIAQFKYRVLDKRLFFGYDLIKSDNYSFFISNPEKTILDYLYLNPHLKEISDFSELRINRRQLQTIINIYRLKKYLSMFSHKRLINSLELFLRSLNVKF